MHTTQYRGGGTRLQMSPNVMSFLKILKKWTFGDVVFETFGDIWGHLETFGDIWRHQIFKKSKILEIMLICRNELFSYYNHGV